MALIMRTYYFACAFSCAASLQTSNAFTDSYLVCERGWTQQMRHCRRCQQGSQPSTALCRGRCLCQGLHCLCASLLVWLLLLLLLLHVGLLSWLLRWRLLEVLRLWVSLHMGAPPFNQAYIPPYQQHSPCPQFALHIHSQSMAMLICKYCCKTTIMLLEFYTAAA